MAFRLTERIQDPAKVDREEIEKILEAGRTATIQFSRPCYNNALLGDINRLCQLFGDELEVRFYGHYKVGFDGKWLAQLPDVVWLSLDCLTTMRSSESLGDLGKLRKLSFGVYNLPDPDLLSRLPLAQLEELRVGGSQKPNFDLGLLELCSQLTSLSIEAQSRGIESISRLPVLRTLRLRSIAKKHALPRLDLNPQLRDLTLILGGREDIDDVASCSLEKLNVVLVRGLATMGNLFRFPSLKELRIEDQSRMTSLHLGNAPKTLEKLILLNCKILADLGDVQTLASLVHLRKLKIGKTALELNLLLAAPLPASLRTFGFWTGRVKEDRVIRGQLDALGYDDKY